jgi:hypothetical protein
VTRYEQVARIYKNIFGKPEDAKKSDELKEALRTYDPHTPGSEAKTVAILKELNDGQPPPFNVDDIGALRRFFIPPQAMSPAQRDKDRALKARRFWRALVFGSIEQVENLWSAIHAFDTTGGADERKALIGLLQHMVPNSEWSEEQLDSLVAIAVHEVEFRDLAWWDAFHDFW